MAKLKTKPKTHAKRVVAPPTAALIAGKEYRVISAHPPWAWAIIFAGKDVENRTWRRPYRGPLLIHASGKRLPQEVLDKCRARIVERSDLSLSDLPAEFPSSTILGVVDLVDCIEDADSPWAVDGNFHWLLHNPMPLSHPVTDVKGKLQLWKWSATDRDLCAPSQTPSRASSRDRPRGSGSTLRTLVGHPIDEIPDARIIAALQESVAFDGTNTRDALRRTSRRLGFPDLSPKVEQVLKAFARRERCL